MARTVSCHPQNRRSSFESGCGPGKGSLTTGLMLPLMLLKLSQRDLTMVPGQCSGTPGGTVLASGALSMTIATMQRCKLRFKVAVEQCLA